MLFAIGIILLVVLIGIVVTKLLNNPTPAAMPGQVPTPPVVEEPTPNLGKPEEPVIGSPVEPEMVKAMVQPEPKKEEYKKPKGRVQPTSKDTPSKKPKQKSK